MDEVKKIGYNFLFFLEKTEECLWQNILYLVNILPLLEKKACLFQLSVLHSILLQDLISYKLKGHEEFKISSEREFAHFVEKEVNTSSGVIHCYGWKISFMTFKDTINLSLKDVLEVLQMKKELEKMAMVS